jgi:hypothetical protein
MKLCIEGRAEDIQQMFGQMVKERGEKLQITVFPCPMVENEPRRFYVEVEMKKKMGKGEVSV